MPTKSKWVTTGHEYYTMVRNFGGHYPVWLTTDGKRFYAEHGIGTDHFEFIEQVHKIVTIKKISDSDGWPSYSLATKARRLVLKGYFGDRLRDAIENMIEKGLK